MKRNLLIGLVVLSLLPGVARAATIGVGAFAGTSMPALQDDNGTGPMYGLRVPVNFVPMITIEPFYAQTNGGNKDQTAGPVTVSFEGIDNTSFGANVLFAFGTGFQMIPFAGISSNHLKRTGLDATQTGYDFGLGFGFSLPLTGLSGSARAAANIVTDPASSNSSRKWGEITVGVSYSLFHPSVVP
jgi:hypothetical protein